MAHWQQGLKGEGKKEACPAGTRTNEIELPQRRKNRSLETKGKRMRCGGGLGEGEFYHAKGKGGRNGRRLEKKEIEIIPIGVTLSKNALAFGIC